ncbi:Glu/Leu/Phe/Val dehydrogenase dimerization domain-containing protein [Jatrophihabitans sp. DSM 45814]
MTAATLPTEVALDFSNWEHERVLVSRGSRSGIPITVAVHSTKLGPALGGCRLWSYPTWREGALDALRLSAAMTVKCAVAGLPTGGGKSVIALSPGEELTPDRRRAALLDLGDAVEMLGGIYRTAEDIGTSTADIMVVRERTQHALGLPSSAGGAGEPAEPTANGVYAALEVVLNWVFGSRQPAGRTFTVVGLGQVGSRLTARLVAAGGEVTVTDVDPRKSRLADDLGARWIPTTEQALHEPSDVLIPAGVGGLLEPAGVADLTCKAIIGPANNQLASPETAELIASRGIVWAPDFVVNAGGAISAILADSQGMDAVTVSARVQGIGATTQLLLDAAAREGITPLAAALSLARQRLSHDAG